jgi:dihydroxyacetone kinase-like protein
MLLGTVVELHFMSCAGKVLLTIFRSYVGEYCTSLEMAGAHISLLTVDAELKDLLLAPAEVAYRVF